MILLRRFHPCGILVCGRALELVHNSSSAPIRLTSTLRRMSMDEVIQYQVTQTENAVVHVTYDPQELPAKPAGSEWTRFVCISDSHCAIFPLPPGDVLIHAGDMTRTVRSMTLSILTLTDESVHWKGAYLELKETIDWIKSTSHAHKLYVCHITES